MYAMTAGALVRNARLAAGLTQRELAARTGTTQSAVARLENDQTNPTVETLEAMLHATGRRLALAAEEFEPAGIDESLIRENLELPMGERIELVGRLYDFARELAEGMARSRGELVD
jgi:transcriptional regulator with XRE-family HTH domain